MTTTKDTLVSALTKEQRLAQIQEAIPALAPYLKNPRILQVVIRALELGVKVATVNTALAALTEDVAKLSIDELRAEYVRVSMHSANVGLEDHTELIAQAAKAATADFFAAKASVENAENVGAGQGSPQGPCKTH